MSIESITTKVIEWGYSSARIHAVYGEGTSDESSLDVHWPSVNVYGITYEHHEKSAMHLIQSMSRSFSIYQDGSLKKVDWKTSVTRRPSSRYHFVPETRDWEADLWMDDSFIAICEAMFPVTNLPNTTPPQYGVLYGPTK